MTEQIGLWRARYTPGDWIVLGGPTSLVILQPAPTHLSALVEQLWQVVVHADSLEALTAGLAQHNVSKMPDFAAFFWHGGSMRSLIRGELQITDLDSGATVADGADVQTWTEIGLGDVRRVRVRLGSEEGTPDSGLRLPLVVGAVAAGSVELDATEEALVHSPQSAIAAVTSLPPAAALPTPTPSQPPVAELESARSAVVDAEVVEDDAQDEAFQLFGEAERRPDQEPFSPFGQPQPMESAAPPPSPPADQQQPSPPADPHNPFAVPAVQDREDEDPRDRFAQQGPGAGFAAPAPFGAPASGAAAFGAPAGMAIPPAPGQQGPGGRDSAYAQGAQPHRDQDFAIAPGPEVAREGMVLGVTCAMNHPNPADAQRCRRCGGPLQGQPRLMPQPVMVVLRPSSGQPVEVDRSVLVGRSPQASKASGDEVPRLLTVVSPSTDISRTHLKVSPDGWETVATDLHSTNGTFLIRPGQPEPERLAPGEPVRIFPGCVLDLGDGVSLHVDHPA